MFDVFDQSFKTAITRKCLSAPMKWLQDQDLLMGRCLDYGCGRGFDASELGMESYDPYWQPLTPRGRFDTVTCVYVLNVLPESSEQGVVASIYKYLNDGGLGYIAVRRDVANLNGETSTGTFQRNVILDLPVAYANSKFAIYVLEKPVGERS
jgi:hypothetical protein